MFTEGQEVWCAIYGAGVVKRIRQESGVEYPVIVLVNSNTDDESVVTYTNDGKYHCTGNVTLFPYPVEIVKATTKPSIDWNHVNESFKWLAMDADGSSYIYADKPLLGNPQWTTNLPCTSATHFASFTPGTCDWKDSLVERPN